MKNLSLVLVAVLCSTNLMAANETTKNVATNLLATDAEREKEGIRARESNAIEELKKQEKERLEKSKYKIENDPFIKKLLLDFLDQMLEKSNARLEDIVNRKITEIELKLQKVFVSKMNTLSMSMDRKLDGINIETKAKFQIMKDDIASEIRKIKEVKEILEKQNIALKEKMNNLDKLFNDIQKKMDDYTNYIDSKFSLQMVKETELSRVLLVKEYFPIKYLKNFNSKETISIVMNNNIEYKINSMVTDRCRIQDITVTHIKVECIDAKNKLFENVMPLRIATEAEDYILQAISKKMMGDNVDYKAGAGATIDGIDARDAGKKLLRK